MIHLQADKYATENNTDTNHHRPVSPIVTVSGLSSPRTAQPPTELLIRFAVLNLLRSTSAVLRVTIILAVLLQSSSAAPVSFGFTGHLAVVKDLSNHVSGVTVGTPFTGTITYDPALTGQPSDAPSPHTEYYNFTNAPGLSFVIQVGSHTFAGAAKTAAQAGIIMFDNYGEDSMSIWLNPSQITHNGTIPPAEYTHGGIGLRLIDYSETAFTTDALPLTRPELNQFTTCEINISLSKVGVPELYYIRGPVTAFTDAFQPRLNIRRLPNGDVQLAWPLAATGFALESRTQLNSGNWEPVVQIAIATDTEYVVTLSTTQAPRFFRLAKTN
jgi:hypothetical protein